ncbi:hypothetical protein [Streptomyces exfoliatus]|uniref:hypothetical protein n=1 Tax=Streptomyces exfoliatus TaxID=1905 RepID=UPI0012FF4486|nr:hypothetical protein [Streptomyces exfoliatus]
MSEQLPNGVQNTWNITVNGGAPQMGQGNVQNNTFGYDPTQLANFAREVLAAAQTADISADDRARVEADVEALQAELARAEPDQGRIRQWTRKILEGARTALPAVLTTGTAQAVALALNIPIGF